MPEAQAEAGTVQLAEQQGVNAEADAVEEAVRLAAQAEETQRAAAQEHEAQHEKERLAAQAESERLKAAEEVPLSHAHSAIVCGQD